MEVETTGAGELEAPPPVIAAPPISSESRNHIEAWIATLENGDVFRSDKIQSFDHLPGKCVSVTFRVEGVEHHVSCIGQFGQSIRLFTRRALKMNGPSATNGEPLNMPIAEIISEDTDVRPRLYVHPRHGVMFSTLDLQL